MELIDIFGMMPDGEKPSGEGTKRHHKTGEGDFLNHKKGRIPANGPRKYQIQNIWDIHHRIMQLALIGMKQGDIARELGVSGTMVSYTLNSEVVKRQMAVMRGAADAEALDIAIEIRRLAPIAVKKLEELMNSENERIKLDTAKDVLDRAGYGAAKRLDISHHLTADDIEQIKERAKLVSDLVEVMDAEYEDIKEGGE